MSTAGASGDDPAQPGERKSTWSDSQSAEKAPRPTKLPKPAKPRKVERRQRGRKG